MMASVDAEMNTVAVVLLAYVACQVMHGTITHSPMCVDYREFVDYKRTSMMGTMIMGFLPARCSPTNRCQ